MRYNYAFHRRKLMANKQIKHTQKSPTSLACHFTVVVESCWINRNISLARGKSSWTFSLKVNIVALNCVPRRDTGICTLGDPRMLFISMCITGGGKGTEHMSETAVEWMNTWCCIHILECHESVEMNSEECNTIYYS